MKFESVKLYYLKLRDGNNNFYALECIETSMDKYTYYGHRIVSSDLDELIKIVNMSSFEEPKLFVKECCHDDSSLIAQYKTPATFAALFRDDHPELFI